MSLQELLSTDSMLDFCPLGVLVLDADGRICRINRVLEDYLRVNAQELVGRDSQSITQDRLADLFKPEETIHLPDADLGDSWLRCWSYPWGEGRVYYYLDITESVQLQDERDQLAEQVKELVTLDSVTGLMNRRSLFQVLDSEVSRSRRYHNPLSLAVLAVDARYPVAAIHASQLTDAMLRVVSGILKDQLRWADQIARLDEQRFMLILPETHESDAAKLTEKLVGRLQELETPDQDGKPLRVSVRFGVAQWCRGDDPRKLFRRVTEKLDVEPNPAN